MTTLADVNPVRSLCDLCERYPCEWIKKAPSFSGSMLACAEFKMKRAADDKPV